MRDYECANSATERKDFFELEKSDDIDDRINVAILTNKTQVLMDMSVNSSLVRKLCSKETDIDRCQKERRFVGKEPVELVNKLEQLHRSRHEFNPLNPLASSSFVWLKKRRLILEQFKNELKAYPEKALSNMYINHIWKTCFKSTIEQYRSWIQKVERSNNELKIISTNQTYQMFLFECESEYGKLIQSLCIYWSQQSQEARDICHFVAPTISISKIIQNKSETTLTDPCTMKCVLHLLLISHGDLLRYLKRSDDAKICYKKAVKIVKSFSHWGRLDVIEAEKNHKPSNLNSVRFIQEENPFERFNQVF
ncbi:hypothetical protein ACOME3_009676 [Neoechinorhynchus agilis]